MYKPETAKQVFLPLAQRLLEFENGEYLNNLHDQDFDRWIPFIEGVNLSAINFDENAVASEALKYVEQISKIRLSVDNNSLPTSLSKEQKTKIIDQVMLELAVYVEHMGILISKGKKVTSGAIDSNPTEYQLPEKLEISKLKNQTFESIFSAKEAAMFFYYMNSAKFIPDYSAASISKMAHWLFWMEPQGIRKAYVIGTIIEDKKNQIALKSKLTAMIDLIETDLKKSKK